MKKESYCLNCQNTQLVDFNKLKELIEGPGLMFDGYSEKREYGGAPIGRKIFTVWLIDGFALSISCTTAEANKLVKILKKSDRYKD